MVDDIQRALGRMESKVDAILEAQKTTVAQFLETERRLSAIEKDIYLTKAVGAALAFVVTIVAAFGPAFFGK
jgi:hypothetical protein